MILSAFTPGVHAQVKPDAGNEESASKKVITFGCLLPLTGEYRVLGDRALKGVLAAAESGHSGIQYRVVVKDIGDNEKRLAASLDELLNTPGLSFNSRPRAQ
jgi:hypothetical protein